MTEGKKGGFFSWFRRRNREEPRQPESTAATPAATPSCPQCGAAMYQRFDILSRALQWGCINYPKCKGTRAL